MAATITFRPRPGIREALDARCNGGGDRTAIINAALAQYLGVEMSGPDSPYSSVGMPSGESRPRRPDPTMVSESGLGGVMPDKVDDKGRLTKPRKRARQAVPDPAGEAPECPHPKEAIKRLPYGKQCTECGQMVRP